jgi:VWFA-related protein
LLLAAVLAAAPAHGQDTDLAFGDVIDVHLVNVEVWVRDPKGNPVTGLTAEDFVVFEDGKRVEVTHFSELRGGAGAPATALERLPIPEEEPAEEAAAGEGDGAGHLVLYLDDLHLGSLSRKDVVEDLRAFVAAGSVPPERVMVLRQTENLSTEAMFGATAADLEAALTRLGAPSPESVQAERDKRLALDRLSQLWDQARNRISTGPSDISTQVCPWYIRSTKIEVDAFARRARTRIETTLEHLSTVSRILAGVAGVKTLVYVADSLEMKPGTDLLAFVYGICPRAEQGDRDYFQTEELGDEFRRFTRHANANRVTFYTLQALGLRSSRFFGADQTAIATIPKGFDVQQRANEREGLTFLAQQTGGRTVFNRGQYTGELERIADDMGTYYWLAYAPPHGGDGFEHRIGVKVTDVPPFATEKKRLEVRHRLGYRDKSADERMAERLQSALYLGEVSNPLAARLGSGDLSDAGKGAFTVPFHVLVPVGSVVFLPHSGGELANLKLQVASREVGTGRVTREEKLFRVERPPQGSSELVDLLVDLRLETGVHVLAVGLRDEATQETSYLTTAIRIQDPAKAGS